MNRVFDFTPAEHEVVVSRILMQLHQAVDDAFPHAQPASPRFAKTAFTNDEPTLTQLVPSEALKEALGLEEDRQPKSNPNADDDNMAGEHDGGMSRGFFAGKNATTQTLIGLLALTLVALVAYFLFAT